MNAKHCVPCEGGILPLSKDDITAKLLAVPLWRVEDQHLRRDWRFSSFVAAIAAVNKVATLSEQENHHPDIIINYNQMRLELWTHAIGGLSENDFVLAGLIDELLDLTIGL